jgi:hypothetical protein
MKLTFSTLLLAASTAFAAPTTRSTHSDISYDLQGVLLTFDLTLPSGCATNPGQNFCPAKLPSGNALLTSRNIALHQTRGKGDGQNNAARAGWFFRPNDGLIEETTLALFNFPSGHTDKQCRFQFVSDEGDDVRGAPLWPNVFNVWQLKPLTGVVGVDTTYFNKPTRDMVVATFSANQDRAGDSKVVKTEGGKYLHEFVYGPAQGTLSKNTTFPCPEGGRVAYEIAGAIKADGENPFNIGGHDGLGIEIIGLKSAYAA